MEGIKLGVREQQYYAELFQACDAEGSGKITGQKASELFLASGLNPDILKQITELCGAKRLGHFGRSQFYIALKLVALAQSGQPVKLDALNSGKDVPLPKFSSKGNDQVVSDRKKSSGEPDSVGPESKLNSQLSGQLPPPPGSKKSHSRSLSGQYRGIVPDAPSVVSSQSSQFSSQTNIRDDSPQNSKSPPFSPTQSPPTSPANQKPLVKQHTAPAMVFANSATNLTSSTPQTQPIMTSSLDSLEASHHLVNPNSMTIDGGHVNPVALTEPLPAARAPGAASGAVGHGASSQVQQSHTQQQQHAQGLENGNWTMFEDDESHMLIGSGVKQHYNSLEPPNFDSSSISSEADSVDDVWTITDEQREYYVNQFKTMQPDLSAVITGPVAKHFFEKSKLPVMELSKIWQLSDLNCDGALSLEEFCIAMHLVVLRRNDIELPDHLPISLMPYSTLASDEPFAADLPPGSTLKRATPQSPQANMAQWTAFVRDSPDSNGVPSPAHLVNFEFAKPSADPELKIVQPVPVHILPEGLPIQSEGFDRGRAFSVPAVMIGQLQPPPVPEGAAASGVVHNERPNDITGGQSHGPPTPPPRPPHGRSMSVDVKSTPQLIAPAIPPRVSPKEVNQVNLINQKAGDIAGHGNFEPKTAPKSILRSVAQTHRRSVSLGVKLGFASAPPELPPENVEPVIADKDKPEDEDTTPDSMKERLQPKPVLTLSSRQGSRDPRDIHMAIRTHKERNTMLTRLNSELNQELQEVMEQRIALEIQLEHLRPFSS
ncbi:ralBP1-associated Eps domain-containing protein 1-like isoform X7 [Physella acuta]|uniref:ralBP1-associated Eps domain-containing protein 1-like isoform X7 n=1 Tax=Physella acuta TaxID=109671 RepID=UPI0027DEA912|nr:ralBP1-associated Eps domain-containing protein 1-like isoform X7 [Physella acuta]